MRLLQSVTHALYHLAARPEYIQPLRDEAGPVIAAEGWTREAMGKLHKLDSLLRESQRHDGIVLSTRRPRARSSATPLTPAPAPAPARTQ